MVAVVVAPGPVFLLLILVELPEVAVRVAMGYDGLANMYQQLGQVLKGLSQARADAKKPS